jgi:hypothetical protein
MNKDLRTIGSKTHILASEEGIPQKIEKVFTWF